MNRAGPAPPRRARPEAARQAPQARGRPPPIWPMRLAGLALLVGLAGVGYATVGWLAAAPEPPSAPLVGASSDPPPAPADALGETGEAARSAAANAVPVGDVETILAADPTAPLDGVALWRLDGMERVLVLDFPSMAEQAAALNRVAALIEKAGLPREHVISQDRLAEYAAARGVTLETFYYGHNYTPAELARFFGLAAAEGRELTLAEDALARLLVQAGALRRTEAGLRPGDAIDYVISLARLDDPGAPVLRRMILRHELGHAVYAARPDYRAHVARFWDERMRPEERRAFRDFLAARDYDVTDRALVIDEMQAYLHFTPDPAGIDDAALGLPPGSLADLRRRFGEGLPPAVRPDP